MAGVRRNGGGAEWSAPGPEAANLGCRNGGAPLRILSIEHDGRFLAAKTKEIPMHKDQVEGGMKDAKGKIKEAAGKATDNERLEAEGNMDQAEGKVQKTVGDAKEGLRDALKH